MTEENKKVWRRIYCAIHARHPNWTAERIHRCTAYAYAQSHGHMLNSKQLDDLQKGRNAMKQKNRSKPDMERIADQIVNYLCSNGLQQDVRIYVNGQCRVFDADENASLCTTPEGHAYYNIPDRDVREYVEYNNPDGITMTFEGILYELINYECDAQCKRDLDAIVKPAGLYWEQGHQWSMAAYPA